MPFYKVGDVAARDEDKAAGEGNLFRWRWIEEITQDGRNIGQWLQKPKYKPGVAFCAPCNKQLRYGKRGLPALREHAKIQSHQDAMKVSLWLLLLFLYAMQIKPKH